MPFVMPIRRQPRNLLALAGLLLACSAQPPAAAAEVSNRYNCQHSAPQASQVFSAFGDAAEYTPVENAGLENGTTGWTLRGRAAVVDDNEPWNVGGVLGSHALDLPTGSSAVTAPICIDPTYPYFRFFAKNANGNNAHLKVEVIDYDSKGNIQKQWPPTYTAQTAGWQPTSKFAITVFSGTNTTSDTPIAFRFVPMGATAHYVIDDVYVDPWSRS